MDSGADTAGEAFDEMLQEKRPRLDAERDESPWAGLHPDALGVVLRFLPCLADRARVRSACRSWRAASRGRGVAPPLPLLVMPRFRFASMTPGGVLTATARRAWMPQEVDADCVGSSDAWLVGARQAGGECFLVNAFSHEVHHLPRLGDSDLSHSACSLRKVVLSGSPQSGPECIVAAFAFCRSKPELALWRPGMKSWCVWQHSLIAGHIDMAFYQGRLYMLWRFTPSLFVFEIAEDGHGVKFSRMKDCLLEKLLATPLGSSHVLSCNMVEWHGRLLLIIRYYGGYQVRHRVLKVEVFAIDLNTKPNSLTEIHSFGGDCVFVGSGGCKSFPAGQYRGVEGDLIYFVPDHYNPHDAFVYNMMDGKTRFIAEPLPCSISAPEQSSGFPVWLFPPE